MKVVKGIIIGLLTVVCLAILGLWALGLRSDRGHFEVSVMINRPPAVVFAALTDPEMTKRWVSGVVEIKKLTEGEAHVGTKLLIIEDIDGRRVEMEEEITYLRPPYIDKYTSTGLKENKFLEHGEYRLEEVNGQTKFTMLSDIEFNGFIHNLLEPLITFGAQRKFAGDQQTLKAILEKETPGASRP